MPVIFSARKGIDHEIRFRLSGRRYGASVS
jgi:hypothetical protein